MKIGIIGPSENEIMPLIEQISNKKVTNIAMLTFHSGIYGNVEIVALYSGE
ncbi:MAG: 5-methylthioadenosine nucleosidase [Clostridiaceae bacterium]|jgi:adenosylhomocysteine nucleosidase|nr:5-methylthioadenosine nucleosidase [Clostridiaceae bacterium]